MVDYGFPIGWQLVREVIDNFQARSNWRELLTEHGHYTAEQVEDFLRALSGSAQNSVDAFLEERGEFLEVGIAAMSIVLIHKEKSESLYRENDLVKMPCPL
jgi:aspartate/tyrosine/aromatic aminotransferase